MEKVKISFNKQTWGRDGTYFRGCFTITERIFKEFNDLVTQQLIKLANKSFFSSNELNDIMFLHGLKIEEEKATNRKYVFMGLAQRNEFVKFLEGKGISFQRNRAFGSFNYYLEIQ